MGLLWRWVKGCNEIFIIPFLLSRVLIHLPNSNTFREEKESLWKWKQGTVYFKQQMLYLLELGTFTVSFHTTQLVIQAQGQIYNS